VPWTKNSIVGVNPQSQGENTHSGDIKGYAEATGEMRKGGGQDKFFR